MSSGVPRAVALPTSFDFAIYRASVLGKCLKRAVDRMMAADLLSPEESKLIFPAFDRSINRRLENLEDTNTQFLEPAKSIFNKAAAAAAAANNQPAAASLVVSTPRLPVSSITLRGDVQSFRFSDDMWLLIGRNFAVHGHESNGQEKILTLDVCKFIACKARSKRRRIG